MAASVHTTCTDSTYDAALKELLTQKAPHFALFSASLGPDGAPWCPDCKQALPVVVAAVAGAAGALLEVQLDRPVWKDKEHPHRFRGAPLNLTGIPTLLFFKPDGTEGARLGEALESADSSEAAAKVVAQFIAETTSA